MTEVNHPSGIFHDAIEKKLRTLLSTLPLEWEQVEPFADASRGYVNACLGADEDKGIDLAFDDGKLIASVFVLDIDSTVEVAAGPQIELIEIFARQVARHFYDDLENVRIAVDRFYQQATMVIDNLKGDKT